MSKRKSAPDLLGDLLAESSSRPVRPAPEPIRTAEPVEVVPARPEPKPAPTAVRERPVAASGRDEMQPKVKMTLVLPPAVADRLARFEMEMRLTTGERGHALSKSAIITRSLELLLDEYDIQGMSSRIAHEMKP